jgi:hypothetical protein
MSLSVINLFNTVKKMIQEDKKWGSPIKKWAFDPKYTNEEEWFL